jgi:predicted CDP-diglyceride synthetase/phosphatidate cytidylyltransferase
MIALIGIAFVFNKGVGVVSFLAIRECFSMTYTRRGDSAALASMFFVVAGSILAAVDRLVRPYAIFIPCAF